ncbi:MAG TPA: methylenetetrahydrofolate reductase [Xanthomonadales bacterium]|nr:methylenetetrahydrofolate reductase [Xanthomonadales bacterium]
MDRMHQENQARSQAPVGQANGLPGYSLEIGAADIGLLEQMAERLPPGTEIFLNVLAGELLADRVEVARRIKALGFVPVPHLAARRLSSENELSDSLHQFISEGGVQDFLVVSGDALPAGPFSDSLEAVEWIAGSSMNIRSLGVTGYPEGHPDRSERELEMVLEQKLQYLAASTIKPFVTLQFSFDAQAIIRWCQAFHRRHPDILVRGGLPGPARLTTLVRFAQRCGVKSSLSRLKSLPLSSSLKLVQRVPPIEQAEAIRRYRMSENPNLVAHLFSFGGLQATLDFIAVDITGPDMLV